MNVYDDNYDYNEDDNYEGFDDKDDVEDDELYDEE